MNRHVDAGEHEHGNDSVSGCVNGHDCFREPYVRLRQVRLWNLSPVGLQLCSGFD